MTPAGRGDAAGAAPDEAAQAEALRFLRDPASHGGSAVEEVVTHISRVFLAGDRAWKLKRAVRTNYLDFSTLARREAACRREIAVNAAASGIYLGVVALTREDGGLGFGGAGPAVDWLVAMRRFDRALEFDRLLEAGRFDLPLVERLADAIAAAHAAAPPAPGYGDAADVAARIGQIAGALAAADPARAGRAAAWSAAARAAAAALGGFFARRVRRGCVRRCHGDLHLGNVVLIGDRPTPFDAIEFDEAIASIDALYDLAFTLEDLTTRGRPDLATALLGRWLGATRDYGGLAGLPLYLSMRGAVRAMVAASRGDPGRAERLLAFAEAALAPRPAPRLVAVGGVSGAGKTTLARALAPGLSPPCGAVVIRADAVRKRLFGLTPEDPLPESAYAPAVSARVYRRLLRDAARALRAGASVIVDATFLDPAQAARAAAAAAAAGAGFAGLWLAAPTAAAQARVAGRARDASDATPALVARQAERAAPPTGWRAIDAGGGPDATLAAARAALG